MQEEIIQLLQKYTGHPHVALTLRGNAAIKAVLSSLPSGVVLIPEEGGWLSYKTLPGDCGLNLEEVRCIAAKIDLGDLQQKLRINNVRAFLYQNLGGYHAAQPMREIYQLCKQNNCLVILDVSGSIGTDFCNGNYADILMGSFGRWKPVDAGKGGFLSCKDETIFAKIQSKELDNPESLEQIKQKLRSLPERLQFLQEKRDKIIDDLGEFKIINKEDRGLVVVVEYFHEKEKEAVLHYCRLNGLEWTECPRYIRLNRKAISIEVKRLEDDS